VLFLGPQVRITDRVEIPELTLTKEILKNVQQEVIQHNTETADSAAIG